MAGIFDSVIVAKFCVNSGVVPVFWGFHGVGKTEITKEITEWYTGRKADYKNYRTINLANYGDPGDLLGLPIETEIKESKRTVYALPEILPVEGDKDVDELGIIFLDEFNRAMPQIMQSMYPLILEGRLHNYWLPKGWRIIVACNPSNEAYSVSSLDEALHSRFCHIPFVPTKEEWLEWAKKNEQIAPLIYNFVENNSEQVLDGKFVPKKAREVLKNSIEVEPNRRAYSLFSKVFQSIENDTTILSEKETKMHFIKLAAQGLLGEDVANLFIKHYKEKIVFPFEIKDILIDYEGKVQSYIHDLLGEKKQNNLSTIDHVIEVLAKEIQKKIIADNEYYRKNLREVSNIEDSSKVEKIDKQTKEVVKTFYIKNDELNEVVKFLHDLPIESVATFLYTRVMDVGHDKNIRNHLGAVSGYIQNHVKMKDVMRKITPDKKKVDTGFKKVGII